MKYVLDYDKMTEGQFEPKRIEYYANEFFEGDKLASVFYLWLFNNFSTCRLEVEQDLGRPMYKKLAKTLVRVIKEEKGVKCEK